MVIVNYARTDRSDRRIYDKSGIAKSKRSIARALKVVDILGILWLYNDRDKRICKMSNLFSIIPGDEEVFIN